MVWKMSAKSVQKKEVKSNRYVLSELVPVSILDMDTGDTYPIGDEGIFETVCELLNKQDELINELNEDILKEKDKYSQLFDKYWDYKKKLNKITDTIYRYSNNLDEE